MQVCTYVGIPWGSSICSLLARETAQNWIAFRGVAKATGVKSPLNNPRTPFKLDYDNILIINNQCKNNIIAVYTLLEVSKIDEKG